jgi:hypothetical protein
MLLNILRGDMWKYLKAKLLKLMKKFPRNLILIITVVRTSNFTEVPRNKHYTRSLKDEESFFEAVVFVYQKNHLPEHVNISKRT